MPTFNVRYYSVVQVRADREIEADTPEAAADLAEQFIDGNVSALEWCDGDGDPVSGEVERDSITLVVYDDKGDELAVR